MKTLILSDLHLRWQTADKIIKHVGADKIVFLGDFFDDFGDDYQTNLQMAEWLAASLEQPNRIHLFGNHDISYAIARKDYKCSGYEVGKDRAINSVLKKEDWKKLQLYTWVGDYLCSHAGVHNYFHELFSNGMPVKTWLEDVAKRAMDKAWALQPVHPLLEAGRSRGGYSKHGGIIWCDVNEFVPILGVKQIFGHTPCRKPKWIIMGDEKDPLYTENIDLDVHTQYYAIHDDAKETNKLTTHWIGDM